jgi:hypothetical protein
MNEQIIRQFAKKYYQAPAHRPFDAAAVQEAVADLKKCGVSESDAKCLLQFATTPNHDLIRQDGHESAGTWMSAKELSLFSALS